MLDVGGHQAFVTPGDEQVGERDVPIPPVVRLISTGAEPVAEGRHRIGVRHIIAGSSFFVAVPSVCDTPCNDGY